MRTATPPGWTVALVVGLRQSEALGLRWFDVDLVHATLTVRRGLHHFAKQSLVSEEPRADRSRPALAKPRPRLRAAERETDRAEGRLARLERLLTAAGVRDVRLHDSRHTAATLLLSEGVHPRVGMEVPGHSQMRTTTDTYSHVMPALGKDAADRMGRAL